MGTFTFTYQVYEIPSGPSRLVIGNADGAAGPRHTGEVSDAQRSQAVQLRSQGRVVGAAGNPAAIERVFDLFP
ncbi:MAG: hypothetical protein K8H88_11130 [Sandaracinaceae bacterium]|nr:hypothetical protein [Sandaracinaceae bacterium]